MLLSVTLLNLTTTRKALFAKMESCCRSMASQNRMSADKFVKNIMACIPPLDLNKHKGQAGRIGIIGGSLEYTGAPYFAGITALKVGADLVHIFCVQSAAPVIKSYSPELIVHPVLDLPSAIPDMTQWFDRLHVIVIGPGLGRQLETLNVITEILEVIREKKIPLVIDADGLFLLTEKPHLLKDFMSPVILTPNKMEFQRLLKKIDVKPEESPMVLGNHVTILVKGATDYLYSVDNVNLKWHSSAFGTGRRCGGQGDLLAGSIATFLHWTLSNQDKIDLESKGDKSLAAASISCYAASQLIRLCNEMTFRNKKRSMLASDMVNYIQASYEELYEL